MIAFEVWKNGTKLCTAGVGPIGYLLGLIHWGSGGDEEPERADLEVSGQPIPSDKELLWASNLPLQRGDEILFRLVEVGEDDVDRPKWYIDLPQANTPGT